MKLFEKPKNQWGWVRVAGLVLLAGILTWTVLAAIFRYFGDISWMTWSGYLGFSFVDGIELAVIPALAVILSEWLERQDAQTESERAHHSAVEHRVSTHRKAILKQLHEDVLAVMDANTPSEPANHRIEEIVRRALPELDGKGKGELLNFLQHQRLILHEKEPVSLSDTDFSGTINPKAHLAGISLDHVNLSNAQLHGVHLGNSHCAHVKLTKAFLQHADLRNSVLTGSDLQGANLESANLEGADLRNTNLELAFLKQANLRNCLLSEKDENNGWSEAILTPAILIDTILPDGRKTTNANGVEYLRKKELANIVDRL